MKKLLIILFVLFVLTASVSFAQAEISHGVCCPENETIVYSNPVYKPMPGDYVVAMPEIQASNIAPAQAVTADTPAIEPNTTAEILKVVLIALGSLMGFVLKRLLPLLNSLLKAHMHFRGSAVVADALTRTLAEMGAEVQKALADGVITSEEKAALKLRARYISKERLKNLSGFYKRDLMGWLDEALEVQLAKLLSRI